MKLKLFGKKDKAASPAPSAPTMLPTPPQPQDSDRRCRQRSPQPEASPLRFASQSRATSPKSACPSAFPEPTTSSRSQSVSRVASGRRPSDVYPIAASPWLEDSAVMGERKFKLRVMVDPVSLPVEGATWTGPTKPFTVEAAAWTPIDELREQLATRLGTAGRYTLGCYKVNIPAAAYQQAKAYTSLYGIPVHLNSHFASYRLSDYQQLLRYQANEAPDFPGSLVSSAETRVARDMTVGDWWPDGIKENDESIAILVRLGPHDPSHKLPLTLLAYMAKPATERATQPSRQQINVATTRHHGSVTSRPPITCELPWDSDVRSLKLAMLKAENKETTHLHRIVIWRVNMSWREMLNCEAFGGLKDGSMPWPYPPNAPQPLELKDLDAPLTRYFGDGVPDSNMVDLYVWIDPRVQDAETEMPPPKANGSTIPYFAFPMPSRYLTGKFRLGSSPRPSTAGADDNDDAESIRPPSRASDLDRSRRAARPITAPAIVQRDQSASSSVHSFGSRSAPSRPREASRSASRHSSTRSPRIAEVPPLPLSKMNLAMNGLTIDITRPESTRSAHSSETSTTTASTRNGSVSLQTISSYSSDYELLTPDDEPTILDRVPSLTSKAR